MCMCMYVCASHSVSISPAMVSRMVDSARMILNYYLPDVYVYTDVVKEKEAERWVRQVGWRSEKGGNCT